MVAASVAYRRCFSTGIRPLKSLIAYPPRRFPSRAHSSALSCSFDAAIRAFSSSADSVAPDLSKIRNVAIIAHVDHGKTSLVDQILRQTGAAMIEKDSRVMDSNAIERERGITILSKSTSVSFQGHRINIVDTPGHSDFGGEVERVLSMVDGVCVVVCATEGPMTQTKFVLSKALERGLKPVVVVNKVDRPTARTEHVLDEVLELFLSLDTPDHLLDYSTVFASAKEGWAVLDQPEDPSKLTADGATIDPLLQKLIEAVPSPNGDRSKPFSLLITQIEDDPYVGKCYLGRIESGIIRVGDRIRSIDPDGNIVSEGKVTKIIQRKGLDQDTIDVAAAGDIVSIAGIENARINHTLCALDVNEPLPYVPVDQPTITMTFRPNDSPLAGREGRQLTSQVIRERLFRETETNISLEVSETNEGDFEVKGRGELQMGVLIENMRREGFELSVSPPRVIYRVQESSDGGSKERTILEPYEEVTIDVDQEFSGIIIEKMVKNKAEMKNYIDSGSRVRMVYEAPTRGLLGYAAEFKNDTHGQGTINSTVIGYKEYKGPLDRQRKGSIISLAEGETTAYALQGIEPRGKLFVVPGVKVYPGMVIGEHSRDSDIEVNPVKAKQLTNLRAAGKEDAIRLTPIEPMPLERIISFIKDDEVIEITPSCIRLRKKELDSNKRKSMKRRGTEFGLPV